MALLDLSNELLGHILSQIPVDIHYPNTIYHVMLTCRRLSAIAMPLLYSRLTFNFPQTAGRMVINSPNPFRDYDNMLSLHPERASWALSASFTYSRNRPDVWDHIANILPKLSLLQSLEIGAGLGHPDPFGEYVGLAVPGRWTFDEDRNFIRLLKQCDHLRSLHTVVVMDRYITLREAWAFFALPHIRVLDMKILNEITAPPDEDDISQEPSKLSAFNLTADMLPNTYAAKHLFRGLSALKELYWSAEHPQPHYSFQHALEIWCPKTIEEAIFPCKSTLSQLQLYNNLTLQHIILPHIEFLEFSVLSVLKISGRILFANASTAPYCNRMNDRDDFVKRLPRNLEQLEACGSYWRGKMSCKADLLLLLI